MTKYLVAGDWHQNDDFAIKIIELAYKHGINHIIQTGDFGIGDWGKYGRCEEYLNIISRHLIKRNIKLYFLPGNHENYNEIGLWEDRFLLNEDGHQEIKPNLFYTNKINMWKWEGKTFGVVGGAVSIDRNLRTPQIDWWPQESLSAGEVFGLISLARKIDYLFTHDTSTQHPFDWLIPDRASQAHREIFDMVGNLYRPSKWFHGHYHIYQEYKFNFKNGGYCDVYSLDADDRACSNYSRAVENNVVILDTKTNQVSRI